MHPSVNLQKRQSVEVKHKIIGSTLYVALSGELDEYGAPTVRETLDVIFERNRLKKVIIDLSELSFMDSTGVGVLIGRYKKLKLSDIPIFIAAPSQAVDKVLSLTGIYEIMPKIVC